MDNRKMIYLDDAIDTLERKKDKKAKGDIGEFYNKIIQNDIDALMQLPPAQPEITEEDVREWCYKRCLTIVDNALYLEMRSRWLPPAQPEIIRCKDCKYLDIQGTYGECGKGILGVVNRGDFCSRAERREE